METIRKVREVFELVKFSHTIFALPFALASMLVAAAGLPKGRAVLLILAAMVTARNAAMAFNRAVDAQIDTRNPRTAGRHVPRGAVSRRFAFGFSLVNAGLFVWVCAAINRPCLYGSLFTLAILLFYSYTKRWTDWSHIVLGFALGLSPAAAWLAVRGGLSTPPIVLGAAVLLWVAGFDILYATLDYDFDRKEGLRSLVVRWGIPKSLLAARLFHGVALLILVLFGITSELLWPYFLAVALIAILFFYEHSLVRPDDLSRVDAAFFNLNGAISLVFLAGVTVALPGAP